MGNVFNILAHIRIMKTVSGIDLQAEIGGMRGGAGVAREFFSAGPRRGGVGVMTGVEFHGKGARAMSGVNLRKIGIDERADANFHRSQLGNDRLDPAFIGNHIKTSLGGDFLPVFRHQTDFIRFKEKRLANHRRSRGHFQIKRNLNGAGKTTDIGGLDVTPVLAQMDGNGLGAALFSQARGFENIGFGR